MGLGTLDEIRRLTCERDEARAKLAKVEGILSVVRCTCPKDGGPMCDRCLVLAAAKGE